MIERMLDHPNIKILLGTDYLEIKDSLPEAKIYYSGPIDEFYGYKYGKLPYRCVNFKIEEYDCEYFQPAAVINYPNNYDYTRITEYKYFLKYDTKRTVIAKEYPSSEGRSAYPIPIPENNALYAKYCELNDGKVTFIGRLGKYKYYSMNDIVQEELAMEL